MKKYANGLKVIIGAGLLLLTLECDVHSGYGQSSPQHTQRSNKVEPTMKCQESLSEKKANANQVSLLAGLKITMSAQFTELRKGQSAPVSVRIENNSDQDLGPLHTWFIELVKKSDNDHERERETYESLINIKEHLVSGDEARQQGVLKTDGALVVNVDLTKLQWRKAISASENARDPFQIIPHGDYQLRFVILIYYKNQNGERATKQVISNEMSVFVYNDL